MWRKFSEYEYDADANNTIDISLVLDFLPKEFVTIEDENGNPIDVINSLKININVNGLEKQVKTMVKHRVDNGYQKFQFI